MANTTTIPSIPYAVPEHTPEMVMEHTVSSAINDLLTLSQLMDDVVGQPPGTAYREAKLFLLTQVMMDKAYDLDQRYEDSLRNYAAFLTGGAA